MKLSPSRRVWLVVRWKDRVKEYMHDRGADKGGRLEQVGSERVDRER